MGLSLDKLFTLLLYKTVIPKNQAQVRKSKNTQTTGKVKAIATMIMLKELRAFWSRTVRRGR